MSASKYTVERQWSNGCEVCPRILEDGRWVADVVGAPHLGHDSVGRAREYAARLEAHADLLAACEAALAEGEMYGELGPDTRGSLAAAIAKAKGDRP